MDIKPPANEIRGNVRLEIRERQDEVGLQGKILSMFADAKPLTRSFSLRARGGRIT